MKVHLCTFGNFIYEKTKWRLAQQASDTDWFDKIFVYGENDLKDYDRSFTGRGAGYWWWKPTIVKKSLDYINDGDILLYVDAGCSLYSQHRDEFYSYIDNFKSTDFVGFRLGNLDRHWTKRDLFKFLDVDRPEFTDTDQTIGGIFFVKKCSWTTMFLDKFEKICSIPHLINDDSSYHPNYDNFQEHRHDQSVISLLTKQLGGVKLPDYTHPGLDGLRPIIATRLFDKKLVTKDQ